MLCFKIKRQLGEYLDGTLAPERERSVAAHLDSCPHCRAERALMERSLRALEGVPAARPSEDLWSSLQSRIEAAPAAPAALSCAAVEARLPAYLEQELQPALQAATAAHLARCPRCARGEAALRRSIALLDALPAETPPRDLWPGVAARLRARPARPGWLDGPLAWKAGALAAGLAAAAVAVALLLPRPAPVAPGHTTQMVQDPAAVPGSSGTGEREKIDVSSPPLGHTAHVLAPAPKPRVRAALVRKPQVAFSRPTRIAHAGGTRPSRASERIAGITSHDGGRVTTGMPHVTVEPPLVVVSEDSPSDLNAVARSLAPMGESLKMSPDLGQLLNPGGQ